MKIKYKQIIITFIIIVLSVVPISYFIANQREKERLDSILKRSTFETRLMAGTALNILLVNGGDLRNTKLDLKEMIKMISSLKKEGLIYADVILISSRARYNGHILAQYNNAEKIKGGLYSGDQIPANEVTRLMKQETVVKRFIGDIKDECLEFTAQGSLPGEEPLCIGRMIFSRRVALAPIIRMRKITLAAIITGLVLIGILGIFLGRMMTKSVEDLISGVERVGSGDMEHVITVRSRDEFARLATTINHFVRVIKMQILELQRTNRELRRLDELKDEFLATVSHELRTPLYGIMGIIETMVDSLESKGDLKSLEDLRLIMISSRRLSELINNILDYSRLKHGDIELVMERVDIFAVTQVVLAILRPLIQNKGLQVANLIPVDSMYVHGDVSRLQQVLLNIIGNAVKFTTRGSITVDSRSYTDDSGESIVEITVTDTGVGFDRDQAEEIFDLFVQGDSSMTRPYTGSGLGLAISKRLVELHGGSIHAEPLDQGGSRFTIVLKGYTGLAGVSKPETEIADIREALLFEEQQSLEGPESAQAGKDDEIVDQSAVKSTIMVIDDEPVILRVLEKSLKQWGYGVITSTHGDEALELIHSGTVPDLIILDVMLPRMSGFDVCRAVRERFAPHELPVLMLTAKGKSDELRTGFECGANDYLAKPVERTELHARVQSLISLKNSVQFANELSIMQHDISLAHEIQQTVVLKEIPEIEGVDIAVRYIPADQLGGDYYDIQKIDDNRIAVLIADVSGHGLPAAFICAMLKVTYAMHLENEHVPHKLMTRINDSMFNFTDDQFVTAFFAVIDLKEKMIYQSSAGQWPLMACSSDGSEVRFVESKGVPFGWVPESNHETDRMEFFKGDRLILFTDGIVELRNADGQMFWTDGIAEMLQNKRGLSCNDFADSVIEKLGSWARHDKFDDDVTLIVIDV